MEIERKYLIHTLPEDLARYPCDQIRQAYVSTSPVIRVRQKNNAYILTVKSGGLLAREEVEMPITEKSFLHLLAKKDGMTIEKKRYKIPDGKGYLIELDVFEGAYRGFCMAEVEFSTIDEANSYEPPAWFGKDVTMDPAFHNSCLSGRNMTDVMLFMNSLKDM